MSPLNNPLDGINRHLVHKNSSASRTGNQLITRCTWTVSISGVSGIWALRVITYVAAAVDCSSALTHRPATAPTTRWPLLNLVAPATGHRMFTRYLSKHAARPTLIYHWAANNNSTLCDYNKLQNITMSSCIRGLVAMSGARTVNGMDHVQCRSGWTICVRIGATAWDSFSRVGIKLVHYPL